MCTNITIPVAVEGAAKGAQGWTSIDTARVSFDHPFHAGFDHSLNIDFVRETSGTVERVAIELSPDSARALAAAIAQALEQGEAEVGSL